MKTDGFVFCEKNFAKKEKAKEMKRKKVSAAKAKEAEAETRLYTIMAFMFGVMTCYLAFNLALKMVASI